MTQNKKITVQELTLRVSAVGLSAFAAIYAILLVLNSFVITAVVKGPLLLIVIFGGVVTILTSAFYKFLIWFASLLWEIALEPDIQSTEEEQNWALITLLLILSIFGAFFYYVMATSDLANSTGSTNNILHILTSSELTGWEQVQGIFFELITSSLIVTIVGGGYGFLHGVYRSVFPNNVCLSCGNKVKPDYRYCPHCCEELEDMYTTFNHLVRMLGMDASPANPPEQGNKEDSEE